MPLAKSGHYLSIIGLITLSRISVNVLTLAACLLILNACTSIGEKPDGIIGAGIIALACKDDSALYLLAREKDVKRFGWGHLGGTQGKGEPLFLTALREFNEESNCSFELANPEALQLTGPSHNGNFSTYHMKVNYIPISQIVDSLACRTDERDQWVWVRRSDLLATLNSTDSPPMVAVIEGERKFVPLWHKAAKALRQAVADKIIPEQDPCKE